jgi:uncharacterized protein YecE (DUF72 family)
VIRIGISGFRYPHWRGKFYPVGLPQKDELTFAARQFGSIEINGSFYSLQRPSYYARWRSQAPAGHVFAVKGGRFITHMKKLRDVRIPLANFFASGVLSLENSLGPLLWQFPEQMPSDIERFAEFFALLPRTTSAAAALAREASKRTDVPRIRKARTLRYAVEIRNSACLNPDFLALLRQHGIAWVIADTAGRFPYLEEITAGFVYIRLHGDTQLYASGYRPTAIERWADRIALWSHGREPKDAARLSSAARATSRDVYAYFDNDGSAHAPHDALALQAALLRRGCQLENAQR